MADALELQFEQEHFDRAWKLREAKRATLADAPRATAGPIGLNARVKQGASRHIEQLANADEAVAFGRFDTADEVVYIGKNLITDDEREPLVVSWQAPIAQPFYQASHVDPLGVLLKRQFETERNTILDFEDVVFAELAAKVEDLTQAGQLGIDDMVLRDLASGRDGEMRDIVRTIHAAQYELIRAPLDELLIIQGGPGTGKTAVALHRVSWLLYNHRDTLSAERMLVVGPNPTFTRYIRSVLPGLGDQAVAHRDLRNLGPQPSHGRSEDAEVTCIKGGGQMARLLRRALRQRVRFPERVAQLNVGVNTGVGFTRDDVEPALARCLGAATYNAGRAQLRTWLTDESSRRSRDRRSVPQSAIDAALERLWPQLTPQAFLRDLLGSRERLLAAAGQEFTAADVTLLQRSASARISEEHWSDADVALLDEADALINGVTETFDHVVVDEAQDLSPMQLRSVRRRSPSGSMTIVGDLAQGTSPWAPNTWDDVVVILESSQRLHKAELTLGYRVPEQILEFAVQLLPYAAPAVTAPTVIRRGPADPCLECAPGDAAPTRAVEIARDYAGRGLFVGIICSAGTRDAIAAELASARIQYVDAGDGKLGQSINLATPDQAKGLEFDAVVVVDPEGIAEGGVRGLRELYIAFTRTTQLLTVVHSGVPVPLPTAPKAAAVPSFEPAAPVLPAPREVPEAVPDNRSRAERRQASPSAPPLAPQAALVDAAPTVRPEAPQTTPPMAPPPLLPPPPPTAPPRPPRVEVPTRRRINVADLVTDTVAAQLADDIRHGVPQPLWGDVVVKVRLALGLVETPVDCDGA